MIKEIVEKILTAMFISAVLALVGLLIYIVFVIAPVSMWADAKCLRNGYPKSAVSFGLETYCMNLDGSVTVKVDKTSEAKR